MTVLAKRSLSLGEVSPGLQAQVDADLYSRAARTLINVVPGRSGGGRNRGGTEYDGEVKDSTQVPRFIPWRASLTDSYVMEFGNGYFRLIRNGEPVREPAKTITGITKANPGVFTVTAHGYSTGDEIRVSGVVGMWQVNGRDLIVVKIDANTYSTIDKGGTALNTTTFSTYVTGGTCERMFEVATPFTQDHLDGLDWGQSQEEMVFAHGSVFTQRLSRNNEADRDWTMDDFPFGPAIAAPTGVSGGTGGTTVYHKLTAVSKDTGEESLPSTEYGTTAAPANLSCTTQAAAAYHKVYQKSGAQYGFIGTFLPGTTFDTTGLTPDLSQNPPAERDAFSLFGLTLDEITPLSSDMPDETVENIAYCPVDDIVAASYGNDIKVYRIDTDGTWDLVDTLSPASASGISGLAWNPQGTLLVASMAGGDNCAAYSRVATTFTIVPSVNFSALPGAQTNHVAFSHDGLGLAFAVNTTPYLATYRVQGTMFEKMPTTVALAGVPNGVCFYPNHFFSVYLLDVQHAGGNGHTPMAVTITGLQNANVAFTATPLTIIQTPGVALNLGGTGSRAAFSPDGQFITWAHAGGSKRTVAVLRGGQFIKITSVGTDPTNTCTSVAWSPDSKRVYLTQLGGDNFIGYSRNGETFTVLENPDTLPADDALAVAIHPQDKQVAVGYTEAGDPAASLIAWAVNRVFPEKVAFHSQRLWLGRTRTDRRRAWGSFVGSYTNFNQDQPLTDRSSFDFRAWGPLDPIQHLLGLKHLNILTAGTEHACLTDNLKFDTINIQPQSFHGANDVKPAVANEGAFFCSRENVIRELLFRFEGQGYTGRGLNDLAMHLFNGKRITRWAWQGGQDTCLWVVLDDGQMLGFTYVREDDVMAWWRFETEGDVLDVCVVPEDGLDRTYLMVRREAGGREVIYRERLALFDQEEIEDNVLVDSAAVVQSEPNEAEYYYTLVTGGGWTPQDSFQIFLDDDPTTTPTPQFSPNDVGNVWKFTAADGTVVTFTATSFSATNGINGTVDVTVPADLRAIPTKSWQKFFANIEGLWHLEGCEVSVYGDGYVVSSPTNPFYANGIQEVEEGVLTLPRAYAKVAVGLPYRWVLETLDINDPANPKVTEMLKNMARVGVDVTESRGFFAGPVVPSANTLAANQAAKLDKSMRKDKVGVSMFDVDRVLGATPLEDLLAEATASAAPFTGRIEVPVKSEWNSHGRVVLVGLDPVPVTINAIYPGGDVGFGR